MVMPLRPNQIKEPHEIGCSPRVYQEFMRMRRELDDMYWDALDGKISGVEQRLPKVQRAKELAPNIQSIISGGILQGCDIFCPMMKNDAHLISKKLKHCDTLKRQKNVNMCHSEAYAMKRALANPSRHYLAFCKGNRHEDVLPQFDKHFRDPLSSLAPPKINR